MTTLGAFGWGFGGSVAVEVVMIAQYFQTQRHLPERYTKLGFYVVRVLLGVVAGGLAVAYDVDKELLALNIGAATPLIIQALAQAPPPGALSVGASTVAPPIVRRAPSQGSGEGTG